MTLPSSTPSVNSSSANDKRHTIRLYRNDQVPFVSICASVPPSQQATVAFDSPNVTSTASPARILLSESTSVHAEPSDSDSYHSPHYPAEEDACCSSRQPDSAAPLLLMIRLFYTAKQNNASRIRQSAHYLTLIFLTSTGWTTVRQQDCLSSHPRRIGLLPR